MAAEEYHAEFAQKESTIAMLTAEAEAQKVQHQQKIDKLRTDMEVRWHPLTRCSFDSLICLPLNMFPLNSFQASCSMGCISSMGCFTRHYPSQQLTQVRETCHRWLLSTEMEQQSPKSCFLHPLLLGSCIHWIQMFTRCSCIISCVSDHVTVLL